MTALRPYPGQGGATPGRGARLQWRLPPTLVETLRRWPRRALTATERSSDLQHDAAASFAAALMGPSEHQNQALRVQPFNGFLQHVELRYLHPRVQLLLRRCTLQPDPTLDGEWLQHGTCREADQRLLAEAVALSASAEAREDWLAPLLRSARLQTPLPPELGGLQPLPGAPETGIDLIELAAWRWRLPWQAEREQRRLARQRQWLYQTWQLHNDAIHHSVFQRLRLPANAWEQRLAMVVSTDDGLRRQPIPGSCLRSAPRPGLDAVRDTRRKLAMLNFLAHRAVSKTPLSVNDIDALHALYAPSLAPDDQGWLRLTPDLEQDDTGLREKLRFTLMFARDFDLDRLSAERAAELSELLADNRWLLPAPARSDLRIPATPGPAALQRLAHNNDGRAALGGAAQEQLNHLEAWAREHPLCGCDDCLLQILRTLQRLFTLGLFRRSNRRLCYNFLLTYYLLRCRHQHLQRGVRQQRALPVPALNRKTSAFVTATLPEQLALVRDGQARFREWFLPAAEPADERQS